MLSAHCTDDSTSFVTWESPWSLFSGNSQVLLVGNFTLHVVIFSKCSKRPMYAFHSAPVLVLILYKYLNEMQINDFGKSH